MFDPTYRPGDNLYTNSTRIITVGQPGLRTDAPDVYSLITPLFTAYFDRPRCWRV
jgi:hypothetical protein